MEDKGLELREYSKEEVASHDKSDDLWFIIGGEVFDVSSYLKQHPGGREAFLGSAGRVVLNEVVANCLNKDEMLPYRFAQSGIQRRHKKR